MTTWMQYVALFVLVSCPGLSISDDKGVAGDDSWVVQLKRRSSYPMYDLKIFPRGEVTVNFVSYVDGDNERKTRISEDDVAVLLKAVLDSGFWTWEMPRDFTFRSQFRPDELSVKEDSRTRTTRYWGSPDNMDSKAPQLDVQIRKISKAVSLICPTFDPEGFECGSKVLFSIVSLNRCEGCKEFAASIYENGQVEFSGQRNTQVGGSRWHEVSRRVVRLLIRTQEKIGLCGDKEIRIRHSDYMDGRIANIRKLSSLEIRCDGERTALWSIGKARQMEMEIARAVSLRNYICSDKEIAVAQCPY